MQEAGPACESEDLRLAGIITYLPEVDLRTPNISSANRERRLGSRRQISWRRVRNGRGMSLARRRVAVP
jgi:hypothetical protein